MKGNEEEHLVRSLKEQINIDREIEEIKKQLALKSDFNLLDAFRVFDVHSRGYITKLEFELALNDMGLYPTKDELYLFFKRFDKDQDGLLRYSDFCKAVLPQSSEYANIMNSRQFYSSTQTKINLDIYNPYI
jgi:Ca2+-binding EF-hand superfamily protein